MITSRRDYVLRLIDEVGRLLARALMKRQTAATAEALDAVVRGCERLFGMEADKLFQLTPEQHFAMLVDGELPEIARDKVLLYAALCAEAGRNYLALRRKDLARASHLNALRLCLRAQAEFSPVPAPLPRYAPALADLRNSLADEPLDPATRDALRTLGYN